MMEIEEKQQYLLDLLKLFAEKCEENSIWYSLSCGSVLGAVRHSGFIPWDDDADVCIRIDDLEKVRDIFKTLPTPYRYLNCDKEFHCTNSHDYLIFQTQEKVCLDIYPLIGAPSSKCLRWIFVKLCHIADRVLKCKYAVPEKSLPKNVKKVRLCKNMDRLFSDRLIHKIYYCLGHIRPLNRSQYCIYIANDGKTEECMESHIILDVMKHRFEDTQLFIPKDYHTYLTRLYGEYMTPVRYK